MFRSLAPRTELRATSVPWLPRAPKDWPLIRLKRLLHEERELVGDAWSETQLLALTKRGVIPRDIDNLEGKVPATFAGYQVVEPSDLVFCLFDVDETPRTVGMASNRGMITAAYTRFRVVGGADPRYLELLFAALDDRKLLRPLYTGLRKSIRTSDLLATSIPLPPAAEQRAIVRYLSHAHQRINTAIASKRRLIELLQEADRSILGDLLAARDITFAGRSHEGSPMDRRAKYVVREVDERSPDGNERALSMSQRLGLVPSEQVTRALSAESMAGGKLVEPGDLVLNRLKAHLGVFAVARMSGVVSPDYTVLRPNAEVNVEYLTLVLRSPEMRGELYVRAKGIVEGFWRLYTDDFYTLRLPIPPLEQQVAIVREVANRRVESDKRLAAVEAEIELLEEFRTRLTADVVTGQLDVRTVAATLPPVGSANEQIADESAGTESFG